MTTTVKHGATEWKVRIASLATFVGSLAAVSVLETNVIPVVNDLPDSIKIIVLPLVLAGVTWLSGRAARSRPEYLAPSTVRAAAERARA